MKDLEDILSFKKYEFNIFFSYEVIGKNIKSPAVSVNLIIKASLSCNNSVMNKDIEFIFLKILNCRLTYFMCFFLFFHWDIEDYNTPLISINLHL